MKGEKGTVKLSRDNSSKLSEQVSTNPVLSRISLVCKSWELVTTWGFLWDKVAVKARGASSFET